MRVLEHVITAREENRTVRSIALKEMHLSRGQFSHLKFSGGVTVDGRPARADEHLAAGQRLTLLLLDGGQEPLTPYDLPLSIPYRDEDYLIIEKPAPLPTLCSARQSGPTLENALYAALGCPENYVFRPVNRLDKGTSGLLAAATNPHAQQLLQKQLHTGKFIREYLAICHGALPREEGVIDLPIARIDGSVKREIRKEGQRAVTRYRVERTAGEFSLVRLRLETGRTHQIRVHMRALGCPVAGDYLYGDPDPRLPGRFALHAAYLSFVHPLTGREIQAESPLPEALFRLMEENE